MRINFARPIWCLRVIEEITLHLETEACRRFGYAFQEYAEYQTEGIERVMRSNFYCNLDDNIMEIQDNWCLLLSTYLFPGSGSVYF